MMRDYENDIERLRCCAELHGECSLCLYQGNPCDCMPETPIREAADAIEELLVKDANVPNKWISVEERLPDLGQKVFTLGPRGALDCGKFIGLVGTRRTDWKDCRWQRFGARKIRFWMPTDFLPAPPTELKEETDT